MLLPMLRSIAVGTAIFALAGCPPAVTGATLTIVGDGVTTDQLAIAAVTSDYRVTRLVPTTPALSPLTLPVSLTASLSTQSPEVSFEVVAYYQGKSVSVAKSAPVALQPGELTPVTVTLTVPTPPRLDLAMAPPPPDLATPPSRCPLAGALVCEGFEAPSFNEWSALETNGTVTIDHTLVYRGLSALATHQLAGPLLSTALLGSLRTLPANEVYLRVFLFAPSPLPASALSFLRLQHSAAPFESLDLQLNTGFFGTRSSKTNVVLRSAMAVPTDRWICVEWHVQFGTTATTSVLVDGAPAPGLSLGQDTTGTVPYDWLLLGLEDAPLPASGSSDYQIWLDELVLSTHPIGCAS